MKLILVLHKKEKKIRNDCSSILSAQMLFASSKPEGKKKKEHLSGGRQGLHRLVLGTHCSLCYINIT